LFGQEGGVTVSPAVFGKVFRQMLRRGATGPTRLVGVHMPMLLAREHTALPATAHASAAPDVAVGATGAAAITLQEVQSRVREVVQAMLPGEEVDFDTPLMDAGIDSLSVGAFRASLQTEFDLPKLSSTLLFDYPKIENLSEYVFDMVGGSAAVGAGLSSDVVLEVRGAPAVPEQTKRASLRRCAEPAALPANARNLRSRFRFVFPYSRRPLASIARCATENAVGSSRPQCRSVLSFQPRSNTCGRGQHVFQHKVFPLRAAHVGDVVPRPGPENVGVQRHSEQPLMVLPRLGTASTEIFSAVATYAQARLDSGDLFGASLAGLAKRGARSPPGRWGGMASCHSKLLFANSAFVQHLPTQAARFVGAVRKATLKLEHRRETLMNDKFRHNEVRPHRLLRGQRAVQTLPTGVGEALRVLSEEISREQRPSLYTFAKF